MAPSPSPPPRRQVNYIATSVISTSAAPEVERSAYLPALVDAVDELAAEVATEVGGRRRTRRRRLEIAVRTPSLLSGFIPTNCPEFLSADRRCEEMTASIVVDFTRDAADPTARVARFEELMTAAIEAGRLQEKLGAGAPVFVWNGQTSGPDGAGGRPISSSGDVGLSPGAISGLVAAGVLGVAMAVIFIVYNRNRNRNRRERLRSGTKRIDADEIAFAGGRRADRDALIMPSGKSPRPPPYGNVQNIDNVYHLDRNASFPAPMTDPTMLPSSSESATAHHPLRDDSSNAGSSGWSSHDDNTDGDRTLPDAKTPPRTTDRKRTERDEDMNDAASPQSSPTKDDKLQMSYSELDQAIYNGDWTAVGVTAALLAAQSSDSRSTPSSSVFSRESYSSSDDDDDGEDYDAPLRPDSDRARELDRLVEASDWEGVIQAAALLERGTHGAADSVASSKASGSQHSEGSNSDSRGTLRSSLVSVGSATTHSDTKRTDPNLGEIRKEVEALVQHVVPEEANNVDEMLKQFKGREEELVETLRTMQERAVALKARLAGHKQAKRAVKDKDTLQKEQRLKAVILAKSASLTKEKEANKDGENEADDDVEEAKENDADENGGSSDDNDDSSSSSSQDESDSYCSSSQEDSPEKIIKRIAERNSPMSEEEVGLLATPSSSLDIGEVMEGEVLEGTSEVFEEKKEEDIRGSSPPPPPFNNFSPETAAIVNKLDKLAEDVPTFASAPSGDPVARSPKQTTRNMPIVIGSGILGAATVDAMGAPSKSTVTDERALDDLDRMVAELSADPTTGSNGDDSSAVEMSDAAPDSGNHSRASSASPKRVSDSEESGEGRFAGAPILKTYSGRLGAEQIVVPIDVSPLTTADGKVLSDVPPPSDDEWTPASVIIEDLKLAANSSGRLDFSSQSQSNFGSQSQSNFGSQSLSNSQPGHSVSEEEDEEDDDITDDQGDWASALAGTSSRSMYTADHDDDVGADSANLLRLRRLAEEQDALVQADIWTAIAEQSKSSNVAIDSGASQAADWAIARSLSALEASDSNSVSQRTSTSLRLDKLLSQGVVDDDDDSLSYCASQTYAQESV